MNKKTRVEALCGAAKSAIVMMVGFCSSFSALASSNVENDGPDAVVAPRAKGVRLIASGQTGGTESGFAPPAPSDIQFVALMGGDLHVQKSAGETIRFPLQIDRVFGNVNKLSGCGAMPSSVVLRMRVWDVDSDYTGGTPEEDHVYVNNHFVGILSGHNQTWTENTFPIPINLLNLKEDENGTGLNTVEIRVAVSGGGWVTKVDWASIYIPAPPPVVIAHGIRDSAEGISELEDAIKGLGLPAHTFSFDNGGNNGIKDGARQLGREISSAKAKFGVEHVNIVAHSMGGLKAREYAENASDVAKVLQIATPNAGAPAADLSIYGKLFNVATYGQFDKVLKKAFGISVWDGALHDLSPSYMAKYNNNKAHHLNSDVYYRVVAGAVDTWFDSALFSLGSKTYGHGEWLNGELVRGDGIVPLESAHTYIGPYDNSPVKGNEDAASHTGLVTTGARNVVEKYLKVDLLEQKTTGQINNPVKMAASRSCRSTATPSFYAKPIYTESGVINLSSSTTSTSSFEIIKGHDTSIWLSLDDCEDFDIVLIAPNGARFSNSSGSVSISKEGGNAFINLSSPEIGQWQLAISAKSTSASVLNVPYVIDINEENSGVDINAWLESDNVRAGEPFHISVRPTIDGHPITGVVYANIRHSLDSQNQITAPKQLTSSGSGVYTGTLSTNGEGEYDIAISVEVQVPTHFTRGAVLTGVAHSSTSTFNNNVSLVAVDPDNNGLYDSLVASFGVNVSKSGTYRVIATLSDADNGTTITEAWTTNVYCAAGVSTMKVNFAGGTLYSYGECGGYVISDVRLMEIGDTYDAVVDSKANVVTTTAYSFGQFEHATLAIKDGGHDVAVDMDRDGTNDCIVAIVPLSVESLASGSYQWSASLITTNGAMLAVDSGSVSLSSEPSSGNRIPMTFSATYIKEHDITGPFQIGNILLWNESTGKYIALEGEYATKNAYPISTWNTATIGNERIVLFVNAAQNDDSYDGRSWRAAKKTIQGAIDTISNTNATIFVYDGVYPPFDIISNQVDVVSANGPEKTVVDGALSWSYGLTNRCAKLAYSYLKGAWGSMSYVVSEVTVQSSITGFTICNGMSDIGGGVYYGIVSNCVITSNRASSKGGGAYYATVYDSVITNNACAINEDGRGGGIYGRSATRCLISNNEARYGGGGADTMLRNCVVTHNYAHDGGGIYASNSYSESLNNCTVIDNIGEGSGGGAWGGQARNSIIWNNSSTCSNNIYNVSTRYCCTDLSVGVNDIVTDPLLRKNKSGIPYLGANSPCIDMGSNYDVVGSLDYCRNPRMVNGTVDMGAIEWQGYEIANSNFTWQSGGDIKWDIDYNQDIATDGCFVSGNISHGQQTWIETTVKGAGVITFDWKVSSEARFDTLSIYVDGVRKKYISGTVDWTTVSISIDTLANHTIKWVYSKSVSGTAGDDCGWVGNVKWTPDVEMNRMVLTVNSAFGNPSPSVGNNNFAWGDEIEMSVAPSFANETVRGICSGWSGSGSVPSSGSGTNLSFTIQEPSVVTWNWDIEYLVQASSTAYGTIDIESVWVADGENITITATPEEACGGFRWCGDVEGATINGYAITIPVDRAKTITAEFLPPSYGSALGIGGIQLSSGGDAVWSIDNSESAFGDGASCRSGQINGQGLSYLEMTVVGPGTLSFMWKLSLGSSVAGIDLLVDGEFVDGLMDETDWAEFSYQISSGTHVIRWEFYRDGAEQGDYACIDHVTWNGSVPASGVVFTEMFIAGDTNWVADADCEMRQYSLTAKTQTGGVYMLNADKWEMINWSADNDAKFEDYYDLSGDGTIAMKSCGYTGCGTLMATYGDVRETLVIKTSRSPTLFWDATVSSNLAYPGALVELSNAFVVMRSDGSTKEIVGFDGLGKCQLHFKQLPIRSSGNAFDDNAPRIVDGHWLRVPKNAGYISNQTAFWMYVEACAKGTSESQFFVVPFAWYESEPVTKATETPVPYEWLIKHYYYAINTDPSVFEACAAQKTGKRDGTGRLMTVADDYIAGTNPRNMESVFKTYIDFKNGKPVISWEPDLNENETKEVREYTTYGCRALGGTWQDMSVVPESEKENYRFFKVTVSMPQIVAKPANVSASQATSAYGIELSWDAVEDAASYEIWRSTSESITEAERIASVQGESTYTDVSVMPTTGYYYWIRAITARGKASVFDEPVRGSRKSETVQVTFDGNGGTPAISNVLYLVGSVYQTLPTPQRVGYDFAGWFTACNEGVFIDTTTIAKESCTALYARWSPHTYTIHFDANGGDGNMANLSMTYGIQKSLTASAFSKQGYYFAGWALSATGDATYANEATVNNLAETQGAVVTLYAYWMSAPSNVTATDGTSTENVIVTWSAASGATSYQVWRSTSADASDAFLIGTSDTLEYTDNDATPGTPYYYTVSAVANNQNGIRSAADVGWRKLSQPIYAGYNEVGSWHSIGGGIGHGGGTYYQVDGYHYYYSLPAGATGFEVADTSSGEPAPDASVATYYNTSSLDYYRAANVISSTPYHYVRAVNDFCKSDWLLIQKQ